MEEQALSPHPTIASWNVFEIQNTQTRHIIGYSSHHKFDVITQELAIFEYNPKTKTGRAVTKTGSVYMLEGKPMRFNAKGNVLLKEFMSKNDCLITFVRQI
mgnify:CR=1 FL=1|tara:strand:- start:9408 stop:9710 length:303 start_codon:yes stop_codon:yes gene_type:complete